VDGVGGCHSLQAGDGRWSFDERGWWCSSTSGGGGGGTPTENAKQSGCGIQNMTPPYRKKLTSDLGWPTSNAIEPKHYVHLLKKLYLFIASRQVRAIWLRWSTSEKSGVFLFVSEIDTPGVIF